MKTIHQLITLLLCFLLCASATFAQQNTSREAQAKPASSQDVTIIIQQDQVRFTSQKPIQMMQLQIFNQSGEKVYDSGPMTVAEINWALQTANGEAIKSGLYAYSLSIHESGAATARVRRGHFIVDRAQDRDGKTDKLWVTSQQDSGIGTELTVARNEDSTVAGTSTASDRASASSRDTTSREVAGKTDTKTSSANDQSKLEAASGTVGQIAKFISGADLGNSVMTEKNGSIGIGTPNPEGLFHVHGTSGGISTGITSSGSGAGFFFRNRETVTATDYWAWYSQGNLARFWRSGVGDLLAIKTDGSVGIGTTPSGYKLDVGGTLRAVRGISNDLVVETTGGTNAWAKMWMMTPSQKWNIGTSQNYKGNQFFLHDATFNQVRMTVQPNGGEIVFPNATSNHLVIQTSGGTNAWAQLRFQTTNQRWAIGSSQEYNGDQLYFSDDSRGLIRMAIQPDGNVGIGTTNPQALLDVAGQTRTGSLEITGGADFAENFDVNAVRNEAAELKIEAGMVVAIDPLNPGKLTLSTQAYNRRVAGIISGAGGVNPGMRMSQAGTLANGQHPIALSGRVYCWVDASKEAIKAGDLLTTSTTPGYAMKATNRTKAQGAILGKAMTSLKAGKGMVLVLVTLQ